MCARYTLRANAGTLMDLFWTEMWPDMEEYEFKYNIPPTEPVVTVSGSPRNARWMRWGLVPSFVDKPGTGPVMLNARSETLNERASFRRLIKNGRCLVPADGFFEWQETGPKTKQPYLFEVDGGEVFAFAGLWDTWRDKEGNVLESCTILTCEPNEFMADIHDRMPVILSRDDYAAWLDPEADITPLLVPFESERMSCRPVNPKMGNSKFQGPQAIEPEPLGGLFGSD